MNFSQLKKIILLLFVIAAFLTFPMIKLFHIDKKQMELRNYYLGKQVVLDGDTLTIVLCDKHHAVLSNKTSIDIDIVEQLLIQK
jgi:hypothetical protein